MKLKFFLLFLAVIGCSAFGASEPIEAPMSWSENFSIYSIHKWHIHSPGYSILWGQHERGRFVAYVDSLNEVSQLDILEGNDKEFLAYAQQLLKDFKRGMMGSAQDAQLMVDALGALGEPSGPITDDSELVRAMGKSSGLIWTGAGISLAAGVPTLKSLYASLGLDYIPYTFMAEEAGLRKIDLSAEHTQRTLFNFLDSVHRAKAVGLKPSVAHHTIKKILDATGSKYITSNLDGLEKASGYGETVKWNNYDVPAFLKLSKTDEPFVPAWILMVGLSGDDYGIAGWASKQGIPIYYVGPNPPETVDLQEFKAPAERINVHWVKADAQTYMPELYRKIWALQNSGGVPSYRLHLYSF